MWGLETFSRGDCGLILAGYRRPISERETEGLLARLRREQLIAQSGRGRDAKFTITPHGLKCVKPVMEPRSAWDRPWDGKWRVFSFDLPVKQSRQRKVLWRALRQQKLGLLQRSVWVWPREVRPILESIVEANGIPECFCGFEAGRLFLCSDEEVVSTAWDFESIDREHGFYLRHPLANPKFMERAADLRVLAQQAWEERRAYADAFARDPLLPRELWPRSYRGAAVEARHREVCTGLARRMRALASR